MRTGDELIAQLHHLLEQVAALQGEMDQSRRQLDAILERNAELRRQMVRERRQSRPGGWILPFDSSRRR